MSDNIANIKLVKNTWTDLYAATGTPVGTALMVENVGACDIFVAVKATEPDLANDAYNVLARESGVRLKNTVGDSGAWAYCRSDGGKIAVGLVEQQGFYPPMGAVRFIDRTGAELLLEDNGGVPVNIQDQTTPVVILPLVQKIGETTTTAATVIGAYTFSVTSTAGMVVGQHIRIINPTADLFFSGTILAINALVITVDSPINFVMASGSAVTFSTTNMNVNGSVTPIAFTLRTGSPSVPSVLDVTRILITCVASSAVALNLFGNIAALTRGILFRRYDGTNIYNIFNVKSNEEISRLAYDFLVWQASNPAQGQDGFSVRLTFAGQEKMGVALRVQQFGNLDMLIQDDLTGLLSFKVTVEGHVVTGAS